MTGIETCILIDQIALLGIIIFVIWYYGYKKPSEVA
jgi:hypothetical protein